MPRHRLVPVTYAQDHAGAWSAPDHGDDSSGARLDQEALGRVYATDTLVSSVRGNAAVSSSTKPDLMARMLELLDVRDGMRVLEIGTGTGYNAALLCHRLGDQHVFSVDVEPELVAAARARLADIGLRPRLAARNGQTGWPGHAPYDRIIATCSVPAIPSAWVEQLRPDGLVLADIKLGADAGNLAVLRRDRPDTAQLQGRFTARWAGFMTARATRGPSTPPHQRAATSGSWEVSRSHTTAPPQPWTTHREAWMLAALRLPAGTVHGYSLDPDTRRPRAARLSTPDGPWCEVALEPNPEPSAPGDLEPAASRWVREAGPTALWATVEQAHRSWQALGRPGWERFGLTATGEHTALWLDQPANLLGRYRRDTDTPHWTPVWPAAVSPEADVARIPADDPTLPH